MWCLIISWHMGVGSCYKSKNGARGKISEDIQLIQSSLMKMNITTQVMHQTHWSIQRMDCEINVSL